MIPIQNRQLSGAHEDGRIRLTWSLLDADPPNPTFFVEHMVGGTWRFPSDVKMVDTTTAELALDAEGPQQFRIIAPDGSPSETVIVDPA